MKTKPTLLTATVAMTSLLASPPQMSAAALPPKNVLLIISDDFAMPVGGDGKPLPKIPNLDRLAESGVRFERAYCQFPLCSPSRTSLLSGRWPAETKVLKNSGGKENFDSLDWMPQTFRDNGYATARIGKILHHEIPKLWDRQKDPSSTDETDQRLQKEAQALSAKEKKGDGDSGTGRFLWAKGTGPEAGFSDAKIASLAISWLADFVSGDKPFFLALGFHKPHHPYVAPEKYFDLYPLEQISWRTEPEGSLANVPPAAITHEPGSDKLSERERKEVMAAYLACESFIDAQIGRVLDELDKLKLSDKTIVVFVGDHGYHLGEHSGVWRKMSLFNESAEAPMIIRAPGEAGNGQACKRPVQFLDIYPTLTALCKIPAPPLDGRSLVPLLENPDAPWPHPAFTFVVEGKDRRGAAISTEEFRYIEWNRGKDGVQLYDMKRDPGEFSNLASDPQLDSVRKDLKQQLDKVPTPY